VRVVLSGVLERRADEVAHVIVRERVVDVLAFAAPPNDVLCMEEAKLLRQCRELRVARLGELRDAALASVERVQQADSGRIPRSSEQRGRPIEGVLAHGGPSRGRIVRPALVRGGSRSTFRHFNVRWSVASTSARRQAVSVARARPERSGRAAFARNGAARREDVRDGPAEEHDDASPDENGRFVEAVADDE